MWTKLQRTIHGYMRWWNPSLRALSAGVKAIRGGKTNFFVFGGTRGVRHSPLGHSGIGKKKSRKKGWFVPLGVVMRVKKKNANHQPRKKGEVREREAGVKEIPDSAPREKAAQSEQHQSEKIY